MPKPVDGREQRADQLARRRAELDDRKPVTPADVDRAAQHADEAVAHAKAAHHSAADKQEQSADLHDIAADVQRRAREADLGDDATRRDAAQRHHEAADRDRAAAQLNRDQARQHETD